MCDTSHPMWCVCVSFFLIRKKNKFYAWLGKHNKAPLLPALLSSLGVRFVFPSPPISPLSLTHTYPHEFQFVSKFPSTTFTYLQLCESRQWTSRRCPYRQAETSSPRLVQPVDLLLSCKHFRSSPSFSP